MKASNVEEVLRKADQEVVGITVTAFNRLGPENLLKNYRIFCLSNGLDLEMIEKDVPVFSLERENGFSGLRNTPNIMRNGIIQKKLNKLETPYLLFYKVDSGVESICRKNDWKEIGQIAPKKFRNKVLFRGVLKELDIPPIPGEQGSLDDRDYSDLKEKYGSFVIQLPDSSGGKGTFFIKSKKDFKRARKSSDRENALVTKMIAGPSPSITGCVTRHGTVYTNLQNQLLDIPESVSPDVGCGVFCGHDWTSSGFEKEVEEQAYRYAEKIGKYLKETGYRGIFGLDLVLDKKTGKLYIVECNPRLLGSFPTLTMVQMLGREPPIIAFHLAEFLDLDYEMNLEEINRLMKKDKKGTHLILYTKSGPSKNHGTVRPGVYRFEGNDMKYLRPGYRLSDLKDKNEFAVVDNPPFRNTEFKKHRRLCRIITHRSITDPETYKLNRWGKKIAEKVRSELDIRPV